MAVPQHQPKAVHTEKDEANSGSASRIYNSEAISLMSMRLMAAPNPEDDLSDEEIYDICKRSPYSREIIKQLIEYIKKL
jgi:hypothetical protein